MEEFASHVEKLHSRVYGSLKGRIRLTLLLRDLEDFCPLFASSPLDILDIGGGEGRFAKLCLERGHRVTLIDSSLEMIRCSLHNLACYQQKGLFAAEYQDFLLHNRLQKSYDLVLLHGAAEWMADSEAALRKACRLVRPGGFLSLLMFNREKNLLKKGINGALLDMRPADGKTLTPPQALERVVLERIFSEQGGCLVLSSGIRIFYGFFHSLHTLPLTDEAWMEQEVRYYRIPPFSMLGEHGHFLVQFP